MADRCELCGARWEPGASTCRECGSSPQPRPHVPDFVVSRPRSVEQGGGRRLGRWLVLAAAAAIPASIVALVLASSPSAPDPAADAAAACPELHALAGAWSFTSVTTGARRDKRRGMREFFELEVQVEGCEAQAQLVNIGRTGAERYDEPRKQRATAALGRGEGAYSFGYGGVFEARNAAGQGIPKQFVFTVDGDRLVGAWRQRGEQWRRSRQLGVLEGRRSGDPLELRPRRRDMPCLVRCAVPKRSVDADGPPDAAAVAACQAACR